MNQLRYKVVMYDLRRRCLMNIPISNHKRSFCTSIRILYKKSKDVDVNSALLRTSELLSHARSKDSVEDSESIVTHKKPQKVDMSFTKDIELKVLSSEERRAIRMMNREKQSSSNEEAKVPSKEPSKVPTNSHLHNDLSKTSRKIFHKDTKPKHRATGFSKPFPKPRSIGLTSTKRKRVHDEDRTAGTDSKNDVSKTSMKFSKPPVFSSILDVKDSSLQQLGVLNKDKIPRLAHNLDKALFSPGVHFLQDPRTRVYNFPPFLKKIMEYDNFDASALPPFVTVSKDEKVKKLAMKHKKKYYSSTSSMTSSMIQFYFLLNNYPYETTERFDFEVMNGMIVQKPAMLMVKKRSNNLYSIEADRSTDNEILLSAMGHCLEALLTTEESEFKNRYEKKNKTTHLKQQDESAYNYSTYGNFLMRSQLDCIDPHLPGNGTFDIKTRAACSVRNNSRDPNVSSNKYQIWKLNGEYESFEKEFKDLIRTGALLKYLFQARIGQMDGIYLAYHNVNTFFGFQYLPLEALDNIFYGSKEEAVYPPGLSNAELSEYFKKADGLSSKFAETQFKMTLSIWDLLLHIIEQDIPDSSFRLIMKSQRFGPRTYLIVYAVKVSDEDMNSLQNFSREYKTSFRHNLSAEELSQNFIKHHEDLEDFNEKLINRSEVHEYTIEVDKHMINGSPLSSQVQVYPKSTHTDWKVKINIHKSDASQDKKKRGCLKMLSSASSALLPSPTPKNEELKISRERRLQIYNLVGEDREAEWKLKDDQQVVYSTKG